MDASARYWFFEPTNLPFKIKILLFKEHRGLIMSKSLYECLDSLHLIRTVE